jgi:MoaA/NifB/PqqE/SkfB family radical SAM enzyme
VTVRAASPLRLPRLPPIGRVARAAITRKVPIYAHWGVTHRCDLTCRMCGIWRYGNQAEELTLDQVEHMARRLRRLGVIQLALGGGEPFVRTDLEDVVGILVSHGLSLRVLTNAVNVAPRRFERCVELGVGSFSVSLDSLHPARFDYICEKEGAWERVVRNMTVIAGLLKGRRGMPTINCVVSHLNLEELPDLVEFARAMGFAISFLPVELLEDPHGNGRPWEDRFIRFQPEMRIQRDVQSAGRVAERVGRAYGAILDLKRRGAPVLNSSAYLEASRTYLQTGRFPPEGCDAGRLYFSIAPNGQFTICHRAQQQHRSILDPDFEAYFHSEAYEHLRRQEVEGCEGCMRACWIDTSYMLRTLQGLAEVGLQSVRPRTRTPLTWEQARAWARTDEADVVPR